MSPVAVYMPRWVFAIHEMIATISLAYARF